MIKPVAPPRRQHAVCLIGWSKPAPTDFGDNRGSWAVRLVTARRDFEAAKADNRANADKKIVVLEYEYAQTEVQAQRLKAALADVIAREQDRQDNPPMLNHLWRNVIGCWESDEGRAAWWRKCVAEASAIMAQQAVKYDAYNVDDIARRISMRAAKGPRT